MTIRRSVKRVIDGDTFQTYRKVNESDFVRLAGVNAPERYQFGGRGGFIILFRGMQKGIL